MENFRISVAPTISYAAFFSLFRILSFSLSPKLETCLRDSPAKSNSHSWIRDVNYDVPAFLYIVLIIQQQSHLLKFFFDLRIDIAHVYLYNVPPTFIAKRMCFSVYWCYLSNSIIINVYRLRRLITNNIST